MKTRSTVWTPLALLPFVLGLACGNSSNPPGSDDVGGGAGTGGAMAGAGGNGGTPATGGTGGTGDVAACGAEDVVKDTDANADILSDFEDGFGSLRQTDTRYGSWYTYGDATKDAVIKPPAAVSPVPAEMIEGGGRCKGGNSAFALHISGGGFSDWGSGTGTDLNFKVPDADAGAGATGKKAPYDASAYTGIAFWARLGNTPGAIPGVRFNLKDKQTDPDGGICSTATPNGPMACHDDFGKMFALTTQWKKVVLKFSDLKQQGFGRKADHLMVDALYAIQIQFPKGGKFDMWLDDIHFVK